MTSEGFGFSSFHWPLPVPMPPLIFLVRHAHAAEAGTDEARQVSPRGREELRKLAHLLRPSGAFAPQEAWHSPLVRARETAKFLLDDLQLTPTFRELRDLEPEADPGLVVPLLAKARASVALFGHEPHLGTLASLLVAGECSPVVFAFQKATVLALEPAGVRWCVRWQLSPDLFGN